MKTFLSSLFILLLASAPSSFAQRHHVLGGTEGHGGDIYCIEFRAAAGLVLDTLKKWEKEGYKDFTDFTTADLERAIEKTNRLSQPIVQVKNPKTGVLEDKSASNDYPASTTITISQQDWANMTLDPVNQQKLALPEDVFLAKMGLALHEYLGILGVELDLDNHDSARFEILFRNRETLTPFDQIRKKVQDLRTAFATGRIPTVEELQSADSLTHPNALEWECDEYGATPDIPSFASQNSQYAFDGSGYPNQIQTINPSGPIQAFKRTQSSFVSQDTNAGETWLEALRITNDQDLIIEVSNSTLYGNQLPSLEVSTAGAYSYRTCSLFNFMLKQALQTYYADLLQIARKDYFSPVAKAASDALNSPAMKTCKLLHVCGGLTKSLDNVNHLQQSSNQAFNADIQAATDRFTKAVSQYHSPDRVAKITDAFNKVHSAIFNDILFALNTSQKDQVTGSESCDHYEDARSFTCIFQNDLKIFGTELPSLMSSQAAILPNDFATVLKSITP